MAAQGPTKSKKRRGQAQIAFDAEKAPDPFDWLVQRWIAIAHDGRISPGSQSKRADKAEALAFQLIPYLKPRLRAIDIDLKGAQEFTVVIGGETPGDHG